MSLWDKAATPDPYDRNTPQTRSTDSKGHFNQLRTNFPPETVSELGIIVASKQQPMFKTPQDIVRHLTFHGLHDIHEQGIVLSPEYMQLQRLEMARERMDRAKLIRDAQKDSAERIIREVREARGAGLNVALDEARRALADLGQWKDEVQEMIARYEG